MAMRATTRETALTGFRFMSLGRGHIFGTGVDSRSCEPFGGMFMILFCRKLFSVKFNLLAGEPSVGQDPPQAGNLSCVCGSARLMGLHGTDSPLID